VGYLEDSALASGIVPDRLLRRVILSRVKELERSFDRLTAGERSLGGIKINHRTEVVTKNHEVIPGLCAAGTDACAILGDSYIFVRPGNTMGFALNSGRMAGENAAAYVRT
jgi:ribulose 1,5-bisphosphate synthetase/thiazole synthase